MPEEIARRPTASRAGLVGFLALFATLYAGYGALSPFLPAFLKSRGLSPEQISWFLAAAMMMRLVAGPLAGRVADRTGATRGLLAVCLALTGVLCTVLLAAGTGFAGLLAIGLALAVATAPLAPLADALALAAARAGRAFEYGWVRAAGSAAFIAATTLTGHLVGSYGHESGLAVGAAAFGLAAVLAPRVRRETPAGREEQSHGFVELLAIARFRRLMLAAALVIGAHAMHDAFAIIVWTEAGVTSGAAALLWSEAVAAEIAVFLWLGPWLLTRLSSPRALALAALAGTVRWAVQSQTSWLPALVGIQCLHGITFALLTLASFALIEESVPDRLRATALAVLGNVGLGLASAAMTLIAGSLYTRFGTHAFLAMSGLSLAAVPVALSLGSRRAAEAPI